MRFLFVLACLLAALAAARVTPTPRQVRQLMSIIDAKIPRSNDTRWKKYGGRVPYSPTTDIWSWKKTLGAAARAESGLICGRNAVGCDSPLVRDSFQRGQRLVVTVNVNVVCFNDGRCPTAANGKPVDAAAVTAQIAELNADFESTRIQFQLAPDGLVFHRNSQYAELSPYGSSEDWFYELQALKDLYSRDAVTALNIFVTGQQSGNSGTLLGIGTFPWDEDSITTQGGLWVNAEFFGAQQKTATHELGHNVGLWHTFHGVSEVACNSPCFEAPHKLGAPEAAYVGDFIETTSATPTNYECKAPTTSVCRYRVWDTTTADYKNFMGYSMDPCMSRFEPQQGFRARCFLCTSLISGQVGNDAACPLDRLQ